MIAFPSDFPQTEVNTKSTIAVTGIAYINASQVCVMEGKMMCMKAKNAIATSHTIAAEARQIIVLFLPRL